MAPPSISLKMKLLRLGAISKEKAVPIYEFTKTQQKEISGMIEENHLILEKGPKIYLSELGADITRGTLRYFTAFSSKNTL